MANCKNCTHCWTDDSVGDRECLMAEEMTEDEIEKYYSEMEDGCPYHKTQEDLDYEYMIALNDVISRGYQPFGKI